LIEDLTRRRERLDEHRVAIRYRVRHTKEVAMRQRDELGHGAVAAHDAEHGARATVARVARPAELARSAAAVDLADDPRSDESQVVAPLDDTDELVPERPSKPRIPTYDLEVRVADADGRDSHERLALAFGYRDVFERDTCSVEANCLHDSPAQPPIVTLSV
jgi:hypothetical protein